MSVSGYVVGVDVGTGSARAGLFDLQGTLIASAVKPIQIWKPRTDFAEQSSTDIWSAICFCVKSVLSNSGKRPEEVIGISFDATCSLVAIDSEDNPVSIDLEGDPQRNIIVWMDHRALSETDEINSGGYDVLKYVGGKLSPEMEIPKLLWLKRNLPESYAATARYFDLADYLTYRSTGVPATSLCTVVCKWTYDGYKGQWDKHFFNAVGLNDLFDNGRVSEDVRPMGEPIGPLCAAAAEELGLTEHCTVGIGIIDAHAGGVGVLGALWKEGEAADVAKLETALALIGGTSNCHMAVSRDPKFINGIWGPYYGAMVPGVWLTEGGQSTAGSAIDHVINDHANAAALKARAADEGKTVYEVLNAELYRQAQAAGLEDYALLTKNIHVLPYFLGNRSPNADPHARAVIEGLSLDETIESQALLYLATIQAVAYGTRDIVRAMNAHGYAIDTLFVTGGGTKNPIWLREHANASRLNLVLPKEPEAVLLGAAILAARASGAYASVPEAMQAMSHAGTTVAPDSMSAAYHARKFEVFRALYTAQKQHQAIMAGEQQSL
jgi:FGGY-family pentulose kinase